MFDYPIDLFLFFCSMLALLMAFTLLTTQIGKTWGKMFGLLLLTTGLIQLRFLLIKHQVAIWIPAKFLGYYSLFYLLGPFGAIAIKRNVDKEYWFDKWQLLVFIPFIFAVGADVSMMLKPLEQQAGIVKNIFSSGLNSLPYPDNLYWWLKGGSYFIVTVYFINLLRRVITLWKINGMSAIIGLSLSFTVSGLFGLICISVAFFTGSIFFRELSHIVLASLNLFLFICFINYPAFFPMLSKELAKTKYRQSRILHLDLESINNSLIGLMETNKLFLDENLTLKQLAEKLSLTSHQLSEFLNNHLDINFKAFVNRYRVDNAKNELTQFPEKSILDIAYDAGFKSRSAFNDAFSKNTGSSPKEFRNRFTSTKEVSINNMYV